MQLLLTVPPRRARRTIYARPHCGLWSHRALEKPVPALQERKKIREKDESGRECVSSCNCGLDDKESEHKGMQ